MRWVAVVCLVVVSSVTFNSCNQGSGDSGGRDFVGNLADLPAAPVASYQPGTPVVVAEATIDEQGGVLAGTDGTPVAGVIVEVPAGALSEPTTLSLGYDDGTFTNVDPAEQTSVIVVRSSGVTTFQRPLSITFPFADPSRVPVPYYINPDGALELLPPLPLDRAAGRGGFTTWHVSDFTFLNRDGSATPYFNGFTPAIDGFPIDNKVHVKYASKGRCYGIASFAKWFKQTQGGGLASQFLDFVPTEAGDRTVKGQEIVATRAHNSIQRYAPDMYAQEAETFVIAVRDALSKGAPAVMVGLAQGDFGHAVLAIAFSDNQIAVYDSNHPGQFKAIDYTVSPPSLSYGSYTAFFLFGNGELPLNETYAHVLQDAKAKFHDENETKIEVTSHQHQAAVDSADVTLEGRVESGQVLIEGLEARVTYDDGTESAPAPFSLLPDDNTYRLPLTLKPGANTIRFTTRGYVAFEGPQEIPNATYEGENVIRDGFELRLRGSCSCSLSGAITLTEECTITFASDPQMGGILYIEPAPGLPTIPYCGGLIAWDTPPGPGTYTFASVSSASFYTNDAGQTGTWGAYLAGPGETNTGSIQLDVRTVSSSSIAGSLTVSMEASVTNVNKSPVTLTATF